MRYCRNMWLFGVLVAVAGCATTPHAVCVYQHDHFVTGVAVCGQTGRIASTAFDGRVVVQSPDGGEPLWLFDVGDTGLPPMPRSKSPSAGGVIFAADGRHVYVLVSGNETVFVEYALTNGAVRTLTRITDWLAAAEASADGRRLVATVAPRDCGDIEAHMLSAHGVVERWVLHSSRPLFNWADLVACDGAGRRVAIGSRRTTIDVFEADGSAVEVQLGGERGFLRVAIADQGRRIVAAVGSRVELWQHPHHEQRRCITLPEGKARAVCFDPSGKLLAVGDDAGRVRLYDTRSLRCRWTIQCGEKDIYAMQFAPHERLLVAGAQDGRVWLCRY
mgnify:CR=1 FL=1